MKRKNRFFPLTAALITVLFASSALAHGGGLDAKGCHTEKRTGEYHCHRAQDSEKNEEGTSIRRVLTYDRKEWHPRRWRRLQTETVRRQGMKFWRKNPGFPLLFPQINAGSYRREVARSVLGKNLHGSPGDILDIDHLVPLKEAHISGGSAWSTEKKRRYANDLSYPATLIAVSSRENRSKGARDPASWLPSNCAYHCEYVRSWKEVKARWELGSDVGREQKH